MDPQHILSPSDTFVHRHIGPTDADIQEMVAPLGLNSLDSLIDATVPTDIRLKQPLALGPHRGEHDVLAELRALHDRTKFSDPLSAWDITIVSHRLSYNGIFSRTPAGIHNIRRISRKSHKVDWKRCSITRR